MIGPRPRRRWAAVLLALALPAVGCQAGRAMIASPTDYAEYRRVRVAETLDERLAAAWYYLEHQPDGVYQVRVRAYFERAEPVLWAVRRQTEAGLEAYLRALPSGPHGAEALSALTELRRLRRRELARVARGNEVGARLDAERRRSRQVGELPVAWLRMLVDPALWSAPLSAAPSSFLVAYRLELPAPVCERDEAEQVFRCSKVIERTFPVVQGDEVITRPVLLWVELVLGDDWQLRQARLLGPELFVRRAEALSRQPLPSDDPAARRRALEQFERRLMEMLSEPALECMPLDSALGLALNCGGLSVVIRRGEDGDDDEIRVEPVAAMAAANAAALPAVPPEADPDLYESQPVGPPD